MTILEKRIMLAAIAIVLLMALFPPWQATFSNGTSSCGYSFFASPATTTGTRSTPGRYDWSAGRTWDVDVSCSIDFSTLMIQWVAVIGAAALYIGWSRIKK